jgi:hypothetical protein
MSVNRNVTVPVGRSSRSVVADRVPAFAIIALTSLPPMATVPGSSCVTSPAFGPVRRHPSRAPAQPGRAFGCGGRRCRGRTWSSRSPAGRRLSRRTRLMSCDPAHVGQCCARPQEAGLADGEARRDPSVPCRWGAARATLGANGRAESAHPPGCPPPSPGPGSRDRR